MADNFNKEAAEILDYCNKYITETNHDALVSSISDDLIGNKSKLLPLIRHKVKIFIKNAEEYEKLKSKEERSSTQIVIKNLTFQKDRLYKIFFEIQDLINAFLGQKVVMTYVHHVEGEKWEVRVFDNSVKHMDVVEGRSWKGPFYKLGYDGSEHYQLLKNSLSEDDNEKLQRTALEVERRYSLYKKRILWYYPDDWRGYFMRNKGPMNEAFVNLFIHDIRLSGSLEKDINTFMLDEKYGAINADATRGFLIGDVRKGGIQYAVKGAFGSPQGIKEVLTEFKKWEKENLSEEGFYKIIDKFYGEELSKKYSSQIKEIKSQKSIAGILRYYKDDLEKIKFNAQNLQF